MSIETAEDLDDAEVIVQRLGSGIERLRENVERLKLAEEALTSAMRESFETGKPVLIGHFMGQPVTVSAGSGA